MTAFTFPLASNLSAHDVHRLRRVAPEIVGIKLEPIVALSSLQRVGAEVLSVLSPPHQCEPFFQHHSAEQSLTLIEAQLASLENIPLTVKLFFNLPIQVLADSRIFTRLQKRLNPNVNIELVDIASFFSLPVALRERVVRHIQTLASQGYPVWLDDVNEALIRQFLPLRLALSGVKIDKVAFWRHRATPALAQLVNLCAQAADHVLIEGIETKRDWEFALHSGAELGQGYYWPSVNWPGN